MRLRKLMRIPKISTAAMIALIAAGCTDSGATNGMSTDPDMTNDAAAADVLGANEAADANATAPEGSNTPI